MYILCLQIDYDWKFNSIASNNQLLKFNIKQEKECSKTILEHR